MTVLAPADPANGRWTTWCLALSLVLHRTPAIQALEAIGGREAVLEYLHEQESKRRQEGH